MILSSKYLLEGWTPVNRRLELLYGREQKKQNLMLENYSTGAKKYIETYFSQL